MNAAPGTPTGTPGKKFANKLPLLIWLVATVLCLGVILRTHFVADMSAFLPSNPDAEQRVLVEQLRDGTIARLMIVGIEGGDAAARHRASRELAAKMRQSSHFISVQNGEAATLERDRVFYFNNRYLLSPATTPEHFSVQGLRDAIGNSLASLSGSAGMMLKSLLPKDPTGETLELIDNLKQGGGPRVVDDVWVSRDDSRSLLLLQTSAAGSDTDAQAITIDAVQKTFDSVRGDAKDMRVLLTGAGVFSVHSRDTIKFEGRLLAGLSMVFVVALLLTVYRSFRLLVLGMMPVLSGALAGITAVSLGFGQVHGLTLGFGATLIGEAVDYSIYLFVQSGQKRGGDAADAIAARGWGSKFWRTVLIGVATSVCGFGAMLVSGFPGLAQLGLYSISGLLAAVIVTRYVLPSLMPRTVNMRDIEPIGARLASAARWLGRGRVFAWVLIVAAAVFLCVKHDRIWNHDISALNPVPVSDQKLDAQLRGELGAPDSRYLLAFNAPDEQTALQAAEKLEAPLRKLVDDGVLASFDSPAHMLPSLATQQARQAALPDAATLRSNLQVALVDMPLRAERLQGFVDDVQATRTRAPLTRADLNGTASALGFDAMLARKTNGYTLLLPLSAPSQDDKGLDLARVRAALDPVSLSTTEKLHIIDLRDQAETLYAGYLDEAIRLAAWGLAAVIAVIALALRDAGRVLRVLVPLTGSVLIVMAGIVLSGHMLSILHLIGLLLTVALGSNYALFFDQSDEGVPPEQQHRTFVSLALANIATVVGFGLLATSSVSVLSALGATVGPGAFLSLLLAAILVPNKRQPASPVTA